MLARGLLWLALLTAVTGALGIVVLTSGADPVAAQAPNTGDGGAPGETGSQGGAALADEPDGQLGAAAPSFSYLFVLGSQLQPRTSSTTYSYEFNGCLTVTGAPGDSRLSFPVTIPANSVIKFLRIYYNDTAPGFDMDAFLTEYDPGQSNQDLVTVSSSGSGGVGTAVSNEITATVTGDSQISINHGWGITDSSNQICGVRVAYYAPAVSATFLPAVLRDASNP